MRFYNNLYAGYNLIFTQFKSSDPRFTSVIFVMGCLLIHFFLILQLAQVLLGETIFGFLSYSKYHVLFVAIPLSIVLFIYYSKKRMNEINLRFEKKTNKEKKVWQLLALLFFVVPLIVFVSLAK